MISQTFSDSDIQLLEQDKYSFAVLKRIMPFACKLKLTDHKRFILCYSNAPFPVWIWTANDYKEEEKDALWQLLLEKQLLGKGMSFNVKYSLAEYLMERAKKEDKEAKIRINMLAYDCPEPIEPHVKAEGSVYTCRMEDLEEVTKLRKAFHDELQIDQMSVEEYREHSKEELSKSMLYFWKNEKGETTACCKIAMDSSIGLVYTLPEHRRKHYAENLVYAVSQIVRQEGKIPTLYTDADYAASNACYQKIGYMCRGELCTVEMTK